MFRLHLVPYRNQIFLGGNVDCHLAYIVLASCYCRVLLKDMPRVGSQNFSPVQWYCIHGSLPPLSLFE